MKLKIRKGTTGKLVRVFVQDTTKSDGSGLTGLTSASAGLVWHTLREGDSAPAAVTPAAMTPGTWVSAGFAEVDDTAMPGLYELGVPNAALAGADSVVMMLHGAAHMAPVLIEIELDAVDYQDSASFGLSAMPLDLAQAIPLSNTAQTLGDALNAARAQGFGNWILTGTTLNLYAPDGITVVHSFTLDDALNPTQRI